MRIRLPLLALPLLLAGAFTASAQFILLDDFQNVATGTTIHGVNGWSVLQGGSGNANNTVTADPTNAANNVLNIAVATGVTSGENNNHAATIADGETGTLSFRFYVPTGNTPDVSIGLASASSTSLRDGTAFGPSFRINSLTLQAFDGATPLDIGTIAVDQWYTVWLVVQNNDGGDAWQAYIQGGAYTNQTQLVNGATSSFSFRTNPPGNFITMDFRANNAHAGDSTLIDDIYLDNTSINLANPVPEPAPVLALAACLGLCLLRRGRRP